MAFLICKSQGKAKRTDWRIVSDTVSLGSVWMFCCASGESRCRPGSGLEQVVGQFNLDMLYAVFV